MIGWVFSCLLSEVWLVGLVLMWSLKICIVLWFWVLCVIRWMIRLFVILGGGCMMNLLVWVLKVI